MPHRSHEGTAGGVRPVAPEATERGLLAKPDSRTRMRGLRTLAGVDEQLFLVGFEEDLICENPCDHGADDRSGPVDPVVGPNAGDNGGPEAA